MARFVGLSLMVVGGLWSAFSGLCSAAFVISFLKSGQISDASSVVFIGAPSVLLGAAIYYIGRLLNPKKI